MKEKKLKTIKPEVLGGFKDVLPAEAIAQENLFSKIRGVYESFGFVPLDTPSMERIEVLTGGSDNFEKSIFVAHIKPGAEDAGVKGIGEGEDFALRFDLTVPLARVVSAYPDLSKPFKRYQIGKVFRGERQQKGRFREFYQCDFDIVGSSSIMSDVEVLQVMHSVMKELGFDNFLIRFNTRKILNGLADVIGCGEKIKLVFRVIDKLDKLGLDGVAAELKKKPENALDDSTLGLSDEQVEKVISFLKIKSGDSSQTLSELKNFFGGVGGVAEKGLAELDFIINSLRELGVPEKNWVLDPSIARGLDYYTGPVFETILTDRPDLGSVFSGGRFDGLTNRFMADSNIPAVGASVGLSRLMVAMKDAGLLPEKNSVTDVLVTVFSPELIVDSAKIAANLRKEGFKTELYFGNDSSLRAQFSYAAKKSIPFTVVIGPDEIKDGKIQLKDMSLRTQEIISLADCVLKLKKFFGR